MSEFKFACPVCGQHMKCDASQGGSVMECPTCFQKITAPQAPAKDSKFILTGTKVSEKKISVRGADSSVAAAAKKPLSAKVFVMIFAACLALGAAFFFIHQNRTPAPVEPPAKTSRQTPPAPVAEAAPPKPATLAPPASDTNWTLTLDAVATPEAAVAGRIHGRDFIAERAMFQSGLLTLRAGAHGPVEFGVLINFAGAAPEALAGKTINVTPDAEKAATVNLRWKDDSGTQKQSYNAGYAMRLEFGALAKGRLSGKIYLCAPDPEKSYLMGSFNAIIAKPKPKTTTPPPAPKK